MIPVLLALAGVLLLPAGAHAFGLEYVVSSPDTSSFTSVVGAFKKAALIFGDKEYSGLFISVAILGFLFAGIGAYVTLAVTGKPPGLQWTITPFLGMAIYLAMIVPKGTLMIYQPAKNQQAAVAGLPVGVIAVFGLFNSIERGFIDMIDASASIESLSYRRQGGGLGFNMLRSLYDSGIPVPDETLRTNLVNYVNTCVSFEIERPGSKLTINSLEKAPDLLTELAKANHPSIYVDYADAMGRTRVPCEEAWAGMKPELEDQVETFGPAVAQACQKNGYDPKDPGAVDRCKESLTGLLGLIWKPGGGGGSMNIEMMTRNFFIAEAFRNAFAADDMDTAVKLRAGQSIGNAGIAQAIVAQDWLPIAQVVMLTIAIGLTPFVALFIPTPIFRRAVGVVAGLNIFLISWRITDAIIYSSLLDKAAEIFAGGLGENPGLSAVLMFQDSNMQALASFANARWQGAAVGLGVVSGLGILTHGAYAWSQASGGLIGQQQSASAGAGTIATPEGGAGLVGGVTRSAMVDMPNTMKYRPEEHAHEGQVAREQQIGASQAFRSPDEAQDLARMGAEISAGSTAGTHAFGGREGAELRSGAATSRAQGSAERLPDQSDLGARSTAWESAGWAAKSRMWSAARASGIIDRGMDEESFYQQLQSTGTIAGRDGQHSVSIAENGAISFHKVDSGRDATRHDSDRTVRDHSTRTTAGAQIDSDSTYSLVMGGRLGSAGLNLHREADRGILAEKVTDYISRNYASRSEGLRENTGTGQSGRTSHSSGETASKNAGLGAGIGGLVGVGVGAGVSDQSGKSTDLSNSWNSGSDVSRSTSWNRISGEVRTAIEGAGGDVGKTQEALQGVYRKYETQSRNAMPDQIYGGGKP